MRLTKRQKRRARENIIPLINVVFLMLIFFLLAGTLVANREAEILLPQTAMAERADAPSGAFYITREGEFRWQGRTTDPESFAREFSREPGMRVQIVADHRLEAAKLIHVLESLREFGLADALIITRRSSTGGL